MIPFKVRRASAIAILAVVMVVAGTILGLLAVLVALQPGQLVALETGQPAEGDWVWLALSALVASSTGAALFVVAFVKLCTNVEFLTREVVEVRAGR
jgi:hypothetical protein